MKKRAFLIFDLLWFYCKMGSFKLLVRRGIHYKERVTPELMDLFMKPLQTNVDSWILDSGRTKPKI
jgi:hypothetical protein